MWPAHFKTASSLHLPEAVGATGCCHRARIGRDAFEDRSRVYKPKRHLNINGLVLQYKVRKMLTAARCGYAFYNRTNELSVDISFSLDRHFAGGFRASKRHCPHTPHSLRTLSSDCEHAGSRAIYAHDQATREHAGRCASTCVCCVRVFLHAVNEKRKLQQLPWISRKASKANFTVKDLGITKDNIKL